MRMICLAGFILVQATLSAQRIGHPGGNLFLNESEESGFEFPNSIGVEFGITREWMFESQDQGGETSSVDLHETYGALSLGGAYTLGRRLRLEFEGKVGMAGQELRGGVPGVNVYEDGLTHFSPLPMPILTFPSLLSLGARGVIAPRENVRIGMGFQLTGSYSTDVLHGDYYNEWEQLVRGDYSGKEDYELYLGRAQIFAGGGIDIPIVNKVVLSPYAGFGASFASGRLRLVHDYLNIFDSSHVSIARLREKNIGFGFLGLDVHLPGFLGKGKKDPHENGVNLGVEAQFMEDGWFLGTGLRFRW